MQNVIPFFFSSQSPQDPRIVISLLFIFAFCSVRTYFSPLARNHKKSIITNRKPIVYLNLDHALFNCLSYEISCYPQVLDFLDLFGAGVSALPVLSVLRFFAFFPSGSVSIAGDGFIVGANNGVSSTVFPRFLFAFTVTVG